MTQPHFWFLHVPFSLETLFFGHTEPALLLFQLVLCHQHITSPDHCCCRVHISHPAVLHSSHASACFLLLPSLSFMLYPLLPSIGKTMEQSQTCNPFGSFLAKGGKNNFEFNNRLSSIEKLRLLLKPFWFSFLFLGIKRNSTVVSHQLEVGN